MNTPTQDVLFTAMRAFILSLISGVEVVQGLGNGVPMPEGAFICMTPGPQKRLSTNESTYNRVAGTRGVKQAVQYSMQIDCYGPDASDYATTLTTMFRDPYACGLMASYGCQPLYAEDPTQSALINGEENYEQRYMFNAVLQFNPVVTVSQEFAEHLDPTFVNVNTFYPVN